MPIVKRNNYLPGQNLTNLSENVDLNRVADDKSFISVDYGTSPATVTIEAGSLIEANGAMYGITSDQVFQMTSTGHSYVIFDGTAFSSATTRGTERPDKGGFYQSDNVSRTLKWIIDQANSKTSLDSSVLFSSNDDLTVVTDLYTEKDVEIENGDLIISTGDIDGEIDILGNSKIRAYMSAVVLSGFGNVAPFDIEVFDSLGEYNNSTYTFTAGESGYYSVGCTINGILSSTSASFSVAITTNGTPTRIAQGSTAWPETYIGCVGYAFLNAGETIQFILGVSSGNLNISSNSSDMFIYRVA